MLSSVERPVSPPSKFPGFEGKFVRFLERPTLPRELALVAVLLSSPALFLRFVLDDYTARYIYADLPGAKWLYEVYSGGYGIANGNPADTLRQVEEAYAPWQVHPDLVIRLFRPIGELFHHVDVALWPNSSFLMHAHSLFWLALLVYVLTKTYRAAMGPLVGGLAALLFAFDHTHGYTAGYIPNRHALLSGLFAVLSLYFHVRATAEPGALRRALGPLFFAVALLCGESSLAIVFYVLGYTAFVDRAPLRSRILAALPYILVAGAWRAFYTAAGYGAHFSAVYIDPAREPLNFAKWFVERGPLLVLGQFLGPPAEIHAVLPPVLGALVLGFAVLFTLAIGIVIGRFAFRDPLARFWAVGALGSLVPAATTHANNRQLLFVSFGAMALVAQLWNEFAVVQRGNRRPSFAKAVSGLVLAFHLVVSPLLMPFTTLSVALSGAIHRGIEDVTKDVAGKDVVFVTAPDIFAVKVVGFARKIDGDPLPRRWRALSFGPQPVRVERPDASTLLLRFENGIVDTPFMAMFRDPRAPIAQGTVVPLDGLRITVREVTADSRPKLVEFAFAASLEDPRYLFYCWKGGHFVPFRVPAVGGSETLPAAPAELGF